MQLKMNQMKGIIMVIMKLIIFGTSGSIKACRPSLHAARTLISARQHKTNYHRYGQGIYVEVKNIGKLR